MSAGLRCSKLTAAATIRACQGVEAGKQLARSRGCPLPHLPAVGASHTSSSSCSPPGLRLLRLSYSFQAAKARHAPSGSVGSEAAAVHAAHTPSATNTLRRGGARSADNERVLGEAGGMLVPARRAAQIPSATTPKHVAEQNNGAHLPSLTSVVPGTLGSKYDRTCCHRLQCGIEEGRGVSRNSLETDSFSSRRDPGCESTNDQKAPAVRTSAWARRPSPTCLHTLHALATTKSAPLLGRITRHVAALAALRGAEAVPMPHLHLLLQRREAAEALLGWLWGQLG